MPHDSKGNLVKVGDEVVIRGKVTSVQTGEDYCNCTVELAPMPPRTTPEHWTGNTKQVEVASSAPSSDPSSPG